MSTSSRRILAVTVAAIIAVLTGILAGMLGGQTRCTAVPPAAVASAAPATATAAGEQPGAGFGSPGGEATRPAADPSTHTAAVDRCTREGFAATSALVAVGGATLAGLAVLVLLLVGTATGTDTGTARPVPPVPVVPPGPRPVPVPGPVPAADGAARRGEADRDTLVRACIYVRDRLTSKALADRLGAALQEVGVSTVEPTGERFDPARHEAGGAAASDEPGRAGAIAAVEVPGYTDRGRVLRAPVVTVYQAAAGRHADREER